MAERKIKFDFTEYLPSEICHEAKIFFDEITWDVQIFNQFKTFEKNINEEALKFAAWWDFMGYIENPHSLILLYENMNTIYKTIGEYKVMNGFNQLQMKMILLYRLLKEKGMIHD